VKESRPGNPRTARTDPQYVTTVSEVFYRYRREVTKASPHNFAAFHSGDEGNRSGADLFDVVDALPGSSRLGSINVSVQRETKMRR